MCCYGFINIKVSGPYSSYPHGDTWQCYIVYSDVMILSVVHAPLLTNSINSIFKNIIFTNTVARLLKLVLRYIPHAYNSSSPIMDMINIVMMLLVCM